MQTTKDQGPVVQSVVSLMSSLRVISLTVLVDSIYNILIFFAEKMWVAFALQKLLIFFQQKISAYLRISVNFYELLTNNVVSFEQLGPDGMGTNGIFIGEKNGSWVQNTRHTHTCRGRIIGALKNT